MNPFWTADSIPAPWLGHWQERLAIMAQDCPAARLESLALCDLARQMDLDRAGSGARLLVEAGVDLATVSEYRTNLGLGRVDNPSPGDRFP